MLKVALIGLGDIARKAYLPVISQMGERIEPILCTRNPTVLSDLKARYRLHHAARDFAEVLRHKPDAVMIHSATNSHFLLAGQAIDAGIATFVDKPLSDQPREYETLINRAIQKQVPLFIGFNRRYAPLYQQLKTYSTEHPPLEIHYRKNRTSLPDQARRFIYDDFIHVLDSLLFLGADTPPTADALHVFSHHTSAGLLAAVSVQWQKDGVLYTAAMNRISAQSRERLQLTSVNHEWQISNVTDPANWSATTDSDPALTPFNDWTPTLYKRGFVTMLETFFQQVTSGSYPIRHYESILATHTLAETVLAKATDR